MREPYHSIVMMLLVLGFAWASFALISRLKEQHGAVWRELGEPSPWGNFVSNSRLKTAKFVYLSGRHRSLGDTAITFYVYAIRALFVAFALGAISKMLGWVLF